MTQLDFLDLAAERQQRACTELARIVVRTRQSFERMDFTRRRTAALKGRSRP